jgi:hypothetical protein
VMLGAAGATTTGVMVVGAPAVCPNAARLKSSANIPARNKAACLEFITNQKLTGPGWAQRRTGISRRPR